MVGAILGDSRSAYGVEGRDCPPPVGESPCYHLRFFIRSWTAVRIGVLGKGEDGRVEARIVEFCRKGETGRVGTEIVELCRKGETGRVGGRRPDVVEKGEAGRETLGKLLGGFKSTWVFFSVTDGLPRGGWDNHRQNWQLDLVGAVSLYLCTS